MIFFIEGKWKVQFYQRILNLNENEIRILVNKKLYIFQGRQLCIDYLQKDELSIVGEVNLIRIENEY